MRDPDEGLAADGTIVAGARLSRVPHAYRPLLDEVVAQMPPGASLHLYGSVATGQAQPGASDVDPVAMGVEPDEAADIARRLTVRFAGLVTEVSLGTLSEQDLGADAAGYGNRVFLKHYCVCLAGPDIAADLPWFRGDRAAARGSTRLSAPRRRVERRSVAHR